MLSVRRLAVVLLVVVLTVGDAALVHAALDRSHRSDPSAASAASAETTSVLTPTDSPSPTSSAVATPPPTHQSGAAVAAASGEQGRLFTAGSATVGWRAREGCSAGPKLQGTSNGGGKWSSLTAPAPHLLRIHLTTPATGWVVGVSSSCGSPALYTTSDGGTAWSAATALGPAWLPLKNGVHTPSGSLATPCGKHQAPIDLAPSGTSDALVICATGVKTTTDSGATWEPVGTIPTGRAVAATVGQSGAAILMLTGAPHCSGLRVLTSSDVGATWKPGACLSGAVAPASVSLTSTGDGLLVSSGRAYATTDGGKRWS